MTKKEDFSSLTYKIFDKKDFPLVSNGLALIIGGAGSGKSYFMYNYLLSVYIEYFKVKHIMICSKTAACDMTLQKSLHSYGDDLNIIIDSDMGKLFDTAQLIRAQAIKTKWCQRLSKCKATTIDKFRLKIRELKD